MQEKNIIYNNHFQQLLYPGLSLDARQEYTLDGMPPIRQLSPSLSWTPSHGWTQITDSNSPSPDDKVNAFLL